MILIEILRYVYAFSNIFLLFIIIEVGSFLAKYARWKENFIIFSPINLFKLVWN